MLDLVFVVDDAEVWHRSNLAVNSDHYSFVQYLGSDTIANIQRAGAGVYYNTLVQINEQVCVVWQVNALRAVTTKRNPVSCPHDMDQHNSRNNHVCGSV